MTPAEPAHLTAPRGTILFRQGDAGDEMFVLVAGRVRLVLTEDERAKEISLLGPGDFFGELSLLHGAPRTATAEVVEHATLLRIGRQTFAMMMQDDLEVVFRMMNVLGQRLSQANDQVRAQMQHLGRIHVLAHCLRRSVAADGTIAIDLDALARELDVTRGSIRAIAEDATRRGAGTVRDGRWHLERQHIARLADELCRAADGAKG